MTQRFYSPMTTQELLDLIAEMGISLEAQTAPDGSDQLIVQEAADTPTPPAVIQLLRTHKSTILWLLRRWGDVPTARAMLAAPPDADNLSSPNPSTSAAAAPAAPAPDQQQQQQEGGSGAVDPVWTPPRWLIDPNRAAPVGIVCGAQLYVWRSAGPRRDHSGLLGDPAQAVDLTAPLEGTSSSSSCPAEDLGALADLMAALHLRAVWLIPAQGSRPTAADCPILQRWGRTDPDALRAATASRWIWHEISARGPAANSALLGGLGFRAAGQQGQATGARRCIYAPWQQDPWAIADDLGSLPADYSPAARARIVASALALAEWALGVQLWYSPAHSGLTLLRETLQQLAARGIALDPLPDAWQDWLRDVRASDVRWARPVPAPELDAAAAALEAAGYSGIPADLAPLHVYDRNSSYVSSARAVPVGVPIATADYIPGCMGVYRVNAAAPAGWDPRTPGIIRQGEAGSAGTYPLRVRNVWTWEPYLRLAVQQGWAVDILEGWYWPKSQRHELLRQWHTIVWDARRSAEHCRAQGQGGLSGWAAALAVHIMKRLGVATIGRLMPREGQAVMTTADALALGYPVEWELTDEAGQLTGQAVARAPLGRRDLVHPEWWSPIIASAGERLLSPICREAPTSTAAGYIDSLYSLVPLPQLAGDPLKVGGYRHNHTVLVPRAVLEAGTFVDIVTAAAHAPELPPILVGSATATAAAAAAETEIQQEARSAVQPAQQPQTDRSAGRSVRYG